MKGKTSMCLGPADASLMENIKLYNYELLLSIDFIPVMKRKDC